VAADQTDPPQLPRPWYYQAWFLYPSFLFWPVWSVLIIRSPWQKNLLGGSIAWAVLFSGIFLAVMRFRQGGTVAYSTAALMAPGLLLTLLTQLHWTSYRRSMGLGQAAGAPGGPAADGMARQGASRRRRGRGGAPARRRG
jgi:hypothetical protein